MTDEDRRKAERRAQLERDARYDAGLASLLTCLRDGHKPKPGVIDLYEIDQGDPSVRVILCERCHLAFWKRDEDAERRAEARRTIERERLASEAAERQQRADMVRDLGGSFKPL